VDRHGIDFRTVDDEPDNLIELKVETVDPLIRQQSLEAVTGVVAFLRDHGKDIHSQLHEVEAETQDSVELRLTNGRTVVWGSAERNEDKLRVLRPLLRVNAVRFDVSAPELPTTTSAE